MSARLDQLRRNVTHGLVRGFLASAQTFPAPVMRLLAHSAGMAASATPPLRRRLQRNLELALGAGHVPPHSVDRYFRNFARLAECQAQVYRRGIESANLSSLGRIGPSIEELDRGVAYGRGVILAAPHLFGHELCAGAVARRHRVVALVRESSSAGKQRIKERWYEALGLETVIRHRSASAAWDLQTCLRVLREGAVLGITPDLLVEPSEGIAIDVFGRTVHVKSGMAALALFSGAPIVTSLCHQTADGTREVVFTAPQFHERPQRASRDRATLDDLTRRITQDWFTTFASYLSESPAEWLFWLDKRWTRAFRETAPAGIAA